MLPNRTLATGKVSGIKKNKESITIGFFVNASGNERLFPVVIGKANDLDHLEEILILRNMWNIITMQMLG